MSGQIGARPSLTIRLMGGLGNQLFQYAFGRRLATIQQAALYLDASAYPAVAEKDPAKGLRICELSQFNIVGTIRGPQPAANANHRSLKRFLGKVVQGMSEMAEARKPYYARRNIVEPAANHFTFDRRILQRPLHGSVSARGYWQTEKYFKEIEPQVRQDLTLRSPLDSESANIAREIKSGNSVGVHVRHGDNAGPVAFSLGVLPQEYYGSVLQSLGQELGAARFYVFSDDIEWAKGILEKLITARYVGHNGPGRAYADLWLMSLCSHHILANSTFGWWAAWIGRKPGQIVYAPRRYYQNVDRPNPDLYPPEWRLV